MVKKNFSDCKDKNENNDQDAYVGNIIDKDRQKFSFDMKLTDWNGNNDQWIQQNDTIITQQSHCDRINEEKARSFYNRLRLGVS